MYNTIAQRYDREEEAKRVGVKYQEDYEVVLAELATVRLRKCEEYGESRYEEEDEDWNIEGVLWDIHRKYIRIRNIFKKWRKFPAGLREALMDMANYCIMGVQLLDRYLPRAAPSRSPFFIEQVALFVPDPEKTREIMRNVLGLDVWSLDTVQAHGSVFSLKGQDNVADLSFNYQLGPFELELIKYKKGSNWLEQRVADEDVPQLSHMGLHVPPGMNLDRIIADFFAQGIPVAQEVTTRAHTNPAIKDSRRYRYVVFDSIDKLGFDLKLIQRLDMNGKPL